MSDQPHNHGNQRQEEIEREQKAVTLFTRFVEENAEELKLIAHWGDGHCGYMLQVLQEKLGRQP